jgi:hypothetical protein
MMENMFAPVPAGAWLLHLMSQHRFDDGEGGICIPAVWRGSDGQFFPAYKTDTGSDIVFSDAPAADPFTASRMAIEFTTQACAVSSL